jgi:photosystem II stability/assembly factor-like uncharacterized protein
MGGMRLAVVLLSMATALSAQTVQTIVIPTKESLRGLAFVSPSTIWASGTHGTYLHSTDAGQSWTAAQVPGAQALDFRDVEAVSDDEVYLLSAGPGDQSRIYKTTDAGRHWTLQFTNPDANGFYDCMAFWDRDHGIALGDPVEGRFELLTTADGGAHWTQSPTSSRPQALPNEGAFAASGSCIAVLGDSHVWFATGGSAARVFRSSDQGKTWSVAETPIVHGPSSSGIFSITFRSAQQGVIAGGDYQHPDTDGENLAVTNDGGATWKALTLHPQYYFSAVAYLDPNRDEILAVGSSRALRLDLRRQKISSSDPLSMNAATRTKKGEAIAVGAKGQGVRWISAEKP